MALQTLSTTIPAGQSLSNGLDCSAGRIVSIAMPTDWTYASLTFQISSDGVGYNDLFCLQKNVYEFIPFELVIPPPGFPNTMGGRVIQTGYDVLRGVGWVKFRSGTRGYSIVQEAERVFAITIDTTPSA